MRRVLKRTAALIGCALVGMQFIPTSAKSNTVTAVTRHKAEMADSQVGRIIARSCQDCHSSTTHWPWYGHVAPVSWVLGRDVNRGRAKLDFSQWAGRTPSANERAEICDAVSDGSMPLLAYRLIHSKARLSKHDVDLICNWAADPGSGESRVQASVSTVMTEIPARPNRIRSSNTRGSR
jgi:hypothetical protein